VLSTRKWSCGQVNLNTWWKKQSMFGEAFTYRDPFGATCTLEQIRIQLERVFALYTQQIILDREILDHLVARNQHHQPRFLSDSDSAVATTEQSHGDKKRVNDERWYWSRPPIRQQQFKMTNMNWVGWYHQYRETRIKEWYILLSAWLNQPHLKTEVLATFNESCQIELFGNGK
jgi:hypothetical protein